MINIFKLKKEKKKNVLWQKYNYYIKMIPELSGVKLHWLASSKLPFLLYVTFKNNSTDRLNQKEWEFMRKNAFNNCTTRNVVFTFWYFDFYAGKLSSSSSNGGRLSVKVLIVGSIGQVGIVDTGGQHVVLGGLNYGSIINLST